MQRANALAGAGLHFNAPGQSPGRPSVIDIQAPVPGSVHDGVMSAAAGARSYAYIDRAVSAALSGDIGVIVTAPINKEALHAAGYPFEGHTGSAHLTGTEWSFMLLASDKLSTIHVSTHVSLAGAVKRATTERELATIRMGHSHLKRIGIANPRIAVAGLNPHSGENGLFGRDEIERTVEPLMLPATRELTLVVRSRETPCFTGPFWASSISLSRNITTRGISRPSSSHSTRP